MSHDTFTKQCREYGEWYADRNRPERDAIACFIFDAMYKPFIQRQAFVEKAHYYYLLRKAA